ncbi:MAG: MATE family efflux transporter [Acidobacteriota bacterium]
MSGLPRKINQFPTNLLHPLVKQVKMTDWGSIVNGIRSDMQGLKLELRPMLSLAVPVVLAELAWITMGIVDTMMVGRLSPEAIGGVSIGSVLFFAVGVFGVGLLFGLDTLVSQAFGAGSLKDCHAWLLHATYLSLILALPLMALISLATTFLPAWGIHPRVLQEAVPYLEVLVWSLTPLLLYTCLRRYLQAMNQVRPIMFALITANLINVAANWVLIFGNLGIPAMGTVGAAWATLISRIYMAMVLFFAVWQHDRRLETRLRHISLRLQPSRLLQLLALGSPAALQTTLEVGVFAAATALAGKLAPIALAAHQIVLNVASFTFMVPLGVSSAGAVRVGQALGRRDGEAARRSGWTALLLGGGFMFWAGLWFWTAPRLILRVFTTDQTVIDTGVILLFVAAFFQLFDGLQVVATGVLRGAGDTRTPMLWNLVGHWFLGLPVGYALCFVLKQGVVGLWVGLSLGLIVVGAALLWVWSRRVRLWHHGVQLNTFGALSDH